jgi:adenosylcobinamide amidohydrolase
MKLAPCHADARDDVPTASLRPGALIIDLQRARRVVSSAPFGGGLGWKRYLVNCTVPLDFDEDVDATVCALLTRHTLDVAATTCALTAVDVQKFSYAEVREDDVCTSVYLTAGLGNLASPGLTPLAPRASGTINIFALVSAALSESALIETIQIVTEVKARRLAGRVTRDGDPATGTSTDSVTVALLSGPSQRYAGAVTPVGRALARATDAALEQALSP